MSNDEPMPGHRPAQWVSGLLAAVFLWGILVWAVPQLRPLRVPTVYAFVPVALALLGFACEFAAAGRDRVHAGALVAGVLFLLSASAADIYATVTHSPDLRREANPVLRALLDSGHSLDFVYAYGVASQALWILVGIVLWVGFLRHRTDLARHMPADGSLLAYLKAGTGGRDLTYRQWLCPFTWSELPRAVPFACWAAVAWIGIGLLRYYAAAEWYRLVLPTVTNRVVACTAFLVIVCTVYALWLRVARRAIPEPEPEPEPEPLPLADEPDEILDLPPDGTNP